MRRGRDPFETTVRSFEKLIKIKMSKKTECTSNRTQVERIIEGHTITIYYNPKHPDDPLMYTHLDKEDMDHIDLTLFNNRVNFINNSSASYYYYLTPWKAAAVFTKAPDFEGKADEYLSTLTEKIIPTVEQEFSLIPKHRIIVGYSIAGLFAVYSTFNCGLFDSFGCVSGSMWYDNFIDYIKTHDVKVNNNKLNCSYFSIGKEEKHTKNERMKFGEEKMKEAECIMREKSVKTIFEFTSGNHFTNCSVKMCKAIQWLLKEEKQFQ